MWCGGQRIGDRATVGSYRQKIKFLIFFFFWQNLTENQVIEWSGSSSIWVVLQPKIWVVLQPIRNKMGRHKMLLILMLLLWRNSFFCEGFGIVLFFIFTVCTPFIQVFFFFFSFYVYNILCVFFSFPYSKLLVLYKLL